MGNDADEISEMSLLYLKGKGSGFLLNGYQPRPDMQGILDTRESDQIGLGVVPCVNWGNSGGLTGPGHLICKTTCRFPKLFAALTAFGSHYVALILTCPHT